MVLIYQAPLVVLAALLLFRALTHARRGTPFRTLISGIAAAIYLLALWVPAILQYSGLMQSKLYNQQLLHLPTTDEIDILSVRWFIELSLISIAEALAVSTLTSKRPLVHYSVLDVRDVRTDPVDERAAWVLVIVGVVANIFLPATSLEDRADGGQGLANLLRSALVVGLALVAYHRFFQRRLYVVAWVAGLAFLIMSNVRSPLFVAGIAFGIGYIQFFRKTSARAIATLAIIVIALGLLGSLMSAVRANITRDLGLSVESIIETALSSPLTSIYESGIDTLDGYRLSIEISKQEPAHPEDLLTVLTNFIPRNIWPEKPTDLTVQMSAKYLNYGASGQFLSPVGYLTLVWGSYFGAILSLIGMSVIFTFLLYFFRNSFLSVVVVVVAFRFFLGGSAFDIYYGLTLAAVYVAARFLVHAQWSMFRLGESSLRHGRDAGRRRAI